MIGQTISHYRILKKIGEGGMGEMYLAEDTSLKLRVALKFLPVSLRHDEASHRRALRTFVAKKSVEIRQIAGLPKIFPHFSK